MLKKYAQLYMADAPAGGGGAAPAAPKPAPLEEKPGVDMVDSMIADMTATSAAAPEPPKPAEPPAPAAPAAKPTPDKPAAPAPAPKPAPAAAKPAAAPAAKPAEKVIDWKTAPQEFRAAHEKLQQEFNRQTGELQTKLTTTETKMRELEQREYLTPEQKEQYQRLETRQQALEADLFARDYRESPDFKAKYDAKAGKIWKNIESELKGLLVTENDATRPATVADIQKVRASGESLVQQRKLAKQMFGEDADVVMGLIGELKAVEDAANDEIDAKRTGWAAERDKAQKSQQQNVQAVRQTFSTFDKTLVDKYPDMFGQRADNPEWNTALEKGLTFVDQNSGGFSGKTPQEQATTAAIIRRWAASWPANQVLIKQLADQLAERDATIKRLQGSDPGAGGEGGGAAPAGDAGKGGVDTLGEELEKVISGA